MATECGTNDGHGCDAATSVMNTITPPRPAMCAVRGLRGEEAARRIVLDRLVEERERRPSPARRRESAPAGRVDQDVEAAELRPRLHRPPGRCRRASGTSQASATERRPSARIACAVASPSPVDECAVSATSAPCLGESDRDRASERGARRRSRARGILRDGASGIVPGSRAAGTRLCSPGRSVMTLPNLISTARVLLVPAVMALILAGFDGHERWAAAVYLVAALSDSLDGYLARRKGWITVTGTFLDPLADKLLVSGALDLPRADPRAVGLGRDGRDRPRVRGAGPAHGRRRRAGRDRGLAGSARPRR